MSDSWELERKQIRQEATNRKIKFCVSSILDYLENIEKRNSGGLFSSQDIVIYSATKSIRREAERVLDELEDDTKCN